MQAASTLVIAGSTAIDRIMSFKGSYKDQIHLDTLHSLSISAFLDEMVDARGGVGANITYSLGLLGEKPVLLTSIGANGDEYLQDLASVGVDTSHVYRSDLPTASFNVITDSDQNQIGGFYPGAMFDSDSISFEAWKDASALFTVSPQDPRAMRRLTDECKTWGLRLFYDPGQQVTNVDPADMRAGIEAAELLILNEFEIGLLSKKIGLLVEDIKAMVPVVVTTYGKQGSVIEGKDAPKAIRVGVAEAEQVADPTGAGDAYRAGFLYAYSRGLPLKACGQLAAVTASFAVEHIGTQIHRFTPAGVQTRYTKAFGKSLELSSK